jgi:hypothetical protein
MREGEPGVIAEALSEDAVLIEIVRFHPYRFGALASKGEATWRAPIYVAFVLPGKSPDGLTLVNLGDSNTIDSLIAAFRRQVVNEASERADRDILKVSNGERKAAYPDPGRALWATVFRPLLGALGARRRLFIAPDGDLSLLPFEALPLDDVRSMIDEYQISYLTVGRDVLRFADGLSTESTAPVVIADPDYDRTGESGSGWPDPREPGRGLVRIAEALNRSRDFDLRSMSFHRLPGTRIEGEKVAALLGVSCWTEKEADVRRLESERSPSILHVATHGFFLEDVNTQFASDEAMLSALPWLGCEAVKSRRDAFATAISEMAVGLIHLFRRFRYFITLQLELEKELPEVHRQLVGLDSLTESDLENPLLRSGLALAGANRPRKESDITAEGDGLLTAADVTGLNLRGTELVVLSACGSGLGEVKLGEGVFGLRRAFSLAGADTLVMSLWKVDDLATAILMERFYANLVLRGLAKTESLRDAQFYLRDLTAAQIRATWLSPEMIERLAAGDELVGFSLSLVARQADDFCPFRHPFYWGAFICQGKPGPLTRTGTGISA